MNQTLRNFIQTKGGEGEIFYFWILFLGLDVNKVSAEEISDQWAIYEEIMEGKWQSINQPKQT